MGMPIRMGGRLLHAKRAPIHLMSMQRSWMSTSRSLADKKNEFEELKSRTVEKSKQLTNRAKQFRDQTIDKSKEVRDQTLQQSKKFKDLTVQRSKEIRDTSIEIKDNFTKIIPPDIHENVYTIPNLLTVTRLIGAPLVGYMVLHGWTTGAFFCFMYCCVTDFLDGLIARQWNLKSAVGSIIDPIADKALMIICTVTLTMTSEVPLYLAALILGRDIMLGIAGFIIRYVTLPAPKTLIRYFDFSIVTVEVHPAMVSKINTALQMLYLGVIMMKPFTVQWLAQNIDLASADAFCQFIEYFEWTVAATTIWSGMTYAFSRNAVKFIKPKATGATKAATTTKTTTTKPAPKSTTHDK